MFGTFSVEYLNDLLVYNLFPQIYNYFLRVKNPAVNEFLSTYKKLIIDQWLFFNFIMRGCTFYNPNPIKSDGKFKIKSLLNWSGIFVSLRTGSYIYCEYGSAQTYINHIFVHADMKKKQEVLQSLGFNPEPPRNLPLKNTQEFFLRHLRWWVMFDTAILKILLCNYDKNTCQTDDSQIS